MTKIIRTPTRAEGGITPEEKQKLDEVAKFWTANALRTDRADINKLAPAVHGIYEAAGLKKPRVVLVPSPLVMAAAYGASAAIWHQRKAVVSYAHAATDFATDAATRDATDVATLDVTDVATDAAVRDATSAAIDNATLAAARDATFDAIDNATLDATHDATFDAIDNATLDAIDNATLDAIDNATLAATRDATDVATLAAIHDATDAAVRDATSAAIHDATYNATDAATYNATDTAIHDATDAATNAAIHDATYKATYKATSAAMLACRELAGDFGVECAKRWWRTYQGGSMWSYWCAYLSGARDVLGLRLPEHEAYSYFEAAALNGGFRVMHEEFCIVSDFPEVLRVDENNQPHCENGPSHRWRDGWELYHWHGVRVPSHWILSPESVDPAEVLATENVEERAAGIAIIGMAKMLVRLPHEIIDSDPDPMKGDLIKVRLPDLPDPAYYLSADCPRNGRIMEAVDPSEMDEMTVRGAQAWRLGIPASEFVYPTVRT